ncbi:hypothetical protein EsDP_00000723 [Epichloe bromicola]|uniref:Alpha/beta hydrolase fold-3 domain-containing protein n=1 Tax=Epichloe bromicola TaxID=79588 RepID=A0ABQ0CFR6_9HYPO
MNLTHWHKACRLGSHSLSQISRIRPFSTAIPERVEVRCGSAGYVTIDLFNTHHASSQNDPLLIHLPPFPRPHMSTPRLPSFLQKRPVASINYRWRPFSEASTEANDSTPLYWPTPVHDTSFAMAWVLDNLSPPGNSRRDIYVYGSYLGASLATSLALTEAHPHARFGVRGLIAHNGIYNWTMFLPDHRVNKAPRRTKTTTPPPGPIEGSHLHRLQENMPALFDTPSNLFDPFASPSLFFHSPGLLVPDSFYMTVEHAALIDNMTSDGDIPAISIKAPRKSHLVFPPRQSTLRIPDTLIVYESTLLPTGAKASSKSRAKTAQKRTKSSGHSFESQATELVELLQRSVDVVELRERGKWDEDIDHWADEARRRVQLVEAGPETGSIEPGDVGCDAISSWIQDRS